MSAERLIVDGYNVLHAHPVYGLTLRDDIDAARARLVSDLAGFAQGGPRTIVVFDGGGNPRSDGSPHHLGALTVIFSPAGATADTVIEALALRFRERGERATVVTSDTATRETVLVGGISVLSSAQFVKDLVGEAEARVADSAGTGQRVPVSARIAPDVSATLARWARGTAPASRHD